MAKVKHTFQSAIPDGTQAGMLQPSHWNAEHTLEDVAPINNPSFTGFVSLTKASGGVLNVDGFKVDLTSAENEGTIFSTVLDTRPDQFIVNVSDGSQNNRMSVGGYISMSTGTGVEISLLNSSWFKVTNLPTYPDNTAAKIGGLTNGMFYKTSTGQLMVVYT